MNTDFPSSQALVYNGSFVVHVSLFCPQCITVSEKGSLVVIVINIIVSNVNIIDGVVDVVAVFVITVVVVVTPVSIVIITSMLVHIQGENFHLFGAPLLGLAKSTLLFLVSLLLSLLSQSLLVFF